MNRTFLLITSLFVAGVFFSCSTTEPEIGNDSELIQLIKSSPNKTNINLEDLPSATRNLLERDFYEDLIEAAKIAPELGYEIDLMRCKGAGLGDKMQVYFDLDGRKLEERGGKGRGGDKGRRGREECFEFLLPVTFTMPDGSTITVEEREDWMEIRNWYKSNPNLKERPSLQYPVEIIFIKDKTTWTLNSDEDLRRAYAECRGGG